MTEFLAALVTAGIFWWMRWGRFGGSWVLAALKSRGEVPEEFDTQPRTSERIAPDELSALIDATRDDTAADFALWEVELEERAR
jgi:hypothetical protein